MSSIRPSAMANSDALRLLRLITSLLRGSARRSRPKEIAVSPSVDPYYESAMRELDRDLGVVK